VVPQDRAAELFNNQIQKVEARIYGQADRDLEVRSFQIIPFRQEKLPSAALGWHGGGEIAVSVQDSTGLQAAEPFFQINAHLAETTAVELFHGRSGKLRFTLEPKPLLTQWSHKLKQLLQKRYQL
jgi:putative peptide zinc metalloprotease protein